MATDKLDDQDLDEDEVLGEEDAEAVEARKAFDSNDADKSSRKHGRSFIYISLEDAEDAVRKIDEHERRMTKTSLAQALGHSKPIGRFVQKLAALESYDLVTVDGDYVLLTDLAVEMLYGPNEQVRSKARAKAFLSYDLFKRTFVECPKNQEHQLSYVNDFVKVTLKIVNERDVFMKRFLESAKFAGLLEGEPDPKAKSIRLRPAVAAPGAGDNSTTERSAPLDEQWIIVPSDDIRSLLDGMGLGDYLDKCEVSQRASGEVSINMADGKIAVEVRRPIRVSIKTNNMLEDVTNILKSLNSKGFKA